MWVVTFASKVSTKGRFLLHPTLILYFILNILDTIKKYIMILTLCSSQFWNCPPLEVIQKKVSANKGHYNNNNVLICC